MENTEKLEWAKRCIESLANGIQPFTGEVSENTILDEPQLIRLFFFVRDVLNDVIKNDGKKRVKETFVLTEELIERIPVSSDRICLTQFLNGIKEINEGKAPKFGAIRDYLVEEEILATCIDANGKTARVATEKAKSLGIENEERNSSRGQYTVVVYDKKGQEYLIECLKKIYT